MIRTLNFAFIAVTGLLCLGLYRIAEEARVAAADLNATRTAIARESDALAVLGAEWARLIQPGRIQALVRRHLDLSDQPAPQLSSLSELPPKNPPLVPEGAIRNANAEVHEPAPRAEPAPIPAPEAQPAPALDAGFAAIHTGT